MRKSLLKCSFLAFFAALSLAVRGAYTGELELDKPDGIYRSGETATCSVLIFKDGKPLVGEKVRVLLRWEAQTVRTEDFVADGRPRTFSWRSDKPGWVYFGVQVLDGEGKPLKASSASSPTLRRRKATIVAEIGALFSPDKIVSAVREPADFDEFWAKRRAEAEAVTGPPTLKELETTVAGVRLFAVTIPGPRGLTATGYLAYPENAKPGTLPAYIFFQGLVYGDVARRNALVRAKSGAVAFAATWHGFPVGRTKKYYDKELHEYYRHGQKGLGDREKWVFTDIFLRVFSELKFLKERPEWNGKTLIVHGISLGGILSAFAAAIDPAVTLAVIGVPSFCECNAYEAGRTPHTVYRRGGIKRLKEHPELAEAGFYYDAVNFSKRIKCETFVFTGFTDESCYPSNVFAFYNTIPATTKKSITTAPHTGHFNTPTAPAAAARMEELITTGQPPENAR